MTSRDIRDQPGLSGRQVRQLNFIKASRIYEFRKYYRSGLRSHIFEVLRSDAVEKESCGVLEDGIRTFPRARPQKMFRIFRSRFAAVEEIFYEIRRYKLLLQYLGPGFIARSEEFIADYREGPDASGSILLCGLQEYVDGEILDPWRLNGIQGIRAQITTMAGHKNAEQRTRTALTRIRTFTRAVRRMVDETGYIPDLAGVGNLILTPEGEIRLVDINNIVAVHKDSEIHLDDRGYPACDVSIQVLFILETELLGQKSSPEDPLARIFLAQERRERVRQIEHKFYKALKENGHVHAH